MGVAMVVLLEPPQPATAMAKIIEIVRMNAFILRLCLILCMKTKAYVSAQDRAEPNHTLDVSINADPV